MTILVEHLEHHRVMLSLPGVLQEPVFVFGFQDVQVPAKADDDGGGELRFGASSDLAGVLRARGLRTVDVLDLFDPRANLRHDMNEPIPTGWRSRYRLVIDIGSLEHVFDTRRCLENLVMLVAVGGHYVTHVPVNGYFAHGLHVFNPETVLKALTLNGFTPRLVRYTTSDGTSIQDPAAGGDVLQWVVARKDRELDAFHVPQQAYWAAFYDEVDEARRRELQAAYWARPADWSHSRT